MSSFGVQQPHTFRQSRPHSRELHYLLFLPSTYAVHPQRWPLMLFLHGAGERGDDLQLVKRHGVANIVEEQPAFPLLVLPRLPPSVAAAIPPAWVSCGTSRYGRSMARAILLSRCNGPWR